MRNALLAAGSLALAGLLAGCSSSVTLIDHPSGSSNVAHVGDTLSLKNGAGRVFELTLSQVVDHAHGQNGSAKKGKHFVAVLLKFKDTSSQGLAGNADADTNLVGANGTLYVPSHTTLRECGNNGTQYHITSGGSATACVAFEVKNSVHVTDVQFSPAAGGAGNYGQWQVP